MMDAGLAPRLGDLMGMMSDCSEGNSFAVSKRIRAGSPLGQAICGSIGAFQQTAPGGVLQGFRLLRPAAPIAFNGRDVVRAANIALQLARDMAPELEIQPELVEQLIMMLFALAVDKFVDGAVLAASNWIHGSSLTTATGPSTSPATSTSSSCSSATTKSCQASCKEYGVIEACETSCETQTADGCAAPTDKPDSGGKPSIVTVTTELWTWEFMPMPNAPPPTSVSSIDCSKVTNVPGKCGTPGCAYVIAKNLGPAALCSNDYCNCGGHVAPLMTTTVSGATSTGCYYTAVPTCGDCNAATCDPKPTSTQPPPAWFPTPSTTWFAATYIYDKWANYYYYGLFGGEKGQGLDPCGRWLGSLGSIGPNNPVPSDFDNIPFPGAFTFNPDNANPLFKGCKYEPGNPGPGNIICGDKKIECKKVKPDPVTKDCNPGDGNGYSVRPDVRTIVVQCIWPE